MIAHRWRVRTAAALAIGASLTLFACTRTEGPILLATTTSVANSGLLEPVVAGYDAGPVRMLQVGSGRALEMLAAGTADLAISHAPFRETAALAAHPSWSYRKILFNDFMLVGPADDPAGVAAAPDAVQAMRRIASSSAPFFSRGDESGTHERERELWTAAGTTPGAGRLVVAGAGMGQTLRVASAAGGYTLTDRGTFLALSNSISLKILHAGDPLLLNTYAVIADPGNRRGAELASWLADGGGRTLMRGLIDSGRVKGFSVWPEGVGRASPDARPR